MRKPTLRRMMLPLLAALLLLAAACAKQPAPEPEPEQPKAEAPRAAVVLLAEDDGSLGQVTVTLRGSGSVVLGRSGMGIVLQPDGSLAKPFQFSTRELRERFGPVLQAMPQPPEHFVLHFRGKTNKLDASSTKLLAAIAKAYEGRPCKDISVVGHTDTVGDHDYNMIVSSRRAEAVASMLEERGIPREAMEITSHGETNPLVLTGDGKANALNKRVEVIVR
jgi:outer membrane protein OmpA-like peptidoglycan-associated protein